MDKELARGVLRKHKTAIQAQEEVVLQTLGDENVRLLLRQCLPSYSPIRPGTDLSHGGEPVSS
jgi:hypothetical protein